MTRPGLIAAALLALLGAARAEQALPPWAHEPHQLVRALQMLQDRIAQGSLESHNAQAAMLKRLGEEFLKADPEVWQDPRNSRAVLTFLLSGGSPQVAVELRSRNVLNIDGEILDGAIAYVEGRPDDAKSRLGGLNPRNFPAALGAELALVQSALVAQDDPKSAIARLDEARLLMPGTLVEEAALRREIFVAGQADDFDKFESLALQYFRRFRHSIYAGNFRQRFALAVARFSFAQQSDRFPRLVALVTHLDRAGQRTLYLLIARTALIRGRTDMANLAAERAQVLAEQGSIEQERARFYRAAAHASTSASEDVLQDLQKIDASRLAKRDVELLTAALAVARDVRKPLPPAAAEQSQKSQPRPRPSTGPRIDFSASRAVVERAQALLDESGVLLKERDQ